MVEMAVYRFREERRCSAEIYDSPAVSCVCMYRVILESRMVRAWADELVGGCSDDLVRNSFFYSICSLKFVGALGG